MQTLNQHISLFESFANNHKQIHSFGNGDLWELTEKENEREYPLMWVQIDPVTVDGMVSIHSYSVVFCDLVHTDESDENEVLSDQQLIAFDFLGWLRNSGEINTYNNVVTASTLTNFTEKWEDVLSGWIITVQIRQPMQYNSCDIPIN